MARDISELHPKLQEIITIFLAECTKKGLPVKITDCVRNKTEQHDCVVRGASSLEYPYSMHNWGVAFDFCRNCNGLEYDNRDKFFDKVGEVGRSLGLEWGGDWKKPVDRPHFQLPDWGTGSGELRRIYGTPEKFRKTWKNKGYGVEFMPRTVKFGSTGYAVKVVQMVVEVESDGIFGKKTYEAVCKFQLSRGIAADGIVGKYTWREIASCL